MKKLFYGLDTKKTLMKTVALITLVFMLSSTINSNLEIEKQYTHADLLALSTKEAVLISEDINEIQEGLNLLLKLKNDYNTIITLDDQEKANITRRMYNYKTGVPWDVEGFFWGSDTAKVLDILSNVDEKNYDDIRREVLTHCINLYQDTEFLFDKDLPFLMEMSKELPALSKTLGFSDVNKKYMEFYIWQNVSWTEEINSDILEMEITEGQNIIRNCNEESPEISIPAEYSEFRELVGWNTPIINANVTFKTERLINLYDSATYNEIGLRVGDIILENNTETGEIEQRVIDPNYKFMVSKGDILVFDKVFTTKNISEITFEFSMPLNQYGDTNFDIKIFQNDLPEESYTLEWNTTLLDEDGIPFVNDEPVVEIEDVETLEAFLEKYSFLELEVKRIDVEIPIVDMEWNLKYNDVGIVEITKEDFENEYVINYNNTEESEIYSYVKPNPFNNWDEMTKEISIGGNVHKSGIKPQTLIFLSNSLEETQIKVIETKFYLTDELEKTNIIINNLIESYSEILTDSYF